MSERLKVNRDIFIKKSDIHGWGVFTSSSIKKGDIVEECVIAYDVIPFDSNALGNYRFIWPSRANPIGYCVVFGFASVYNHSNEKASINWEINEEDRLLTFTAIRDIEVGEELLFDYQLRHKLNTITKR